MASSNGFFGPRYCKSTVKGNGSHFKCIYSENLTRTNKKLGRGGRTGLMARASDSGSGDPGSILGRVGVFVSLSKRHLLPEKVLVIPRNRWLRLNMTEKLFTGTLNHNQNKTKSWEIQNSTGTRKKLNNLLFEVTFYILLLTPFRSFRN